MGAIIETCNKKPKKKYENKKNKFYIGKPSF